MKKLLSLLICAAILAGCVPAGFGQKVSFEYPDIKDDFCGVHINFQFCKCAFHNEYCDAVGMSKSQASSHVQAEYEKWVAAQLATFGQACTTAGGIFNKDVCQYCKDGFLVQADQCLSAEEVKTEFKPDGPLSSSCQIIPEQFAADWKKYSDIDSRIPFEDRSFEAKQALNSYEAMIELMVEGFELERDYEIEQQMIAELEEYKAALIKDLKTNLLKAFWRLSWVTYTTIQSGKGLGESYTNLLTSAEGVEAVGTGLKLVQGVIPSDSSLAIDTSTVSGKAKSVGASVALEAVESLGDPLKIATELFKSAANAPLPSADLSEEEIDILKQQHLSNGVIDQVLSDSKTANGARLVRMNEIEQEIIELQEEINTFEAMEKERVKVSLEQSCQEFKKQFEQNN